jgi:hypothetical protein
MKVTQRACIRDKLVIWRLRGGNKHLYRRLEREGTMDCMICLLCDRVTLLYSNEPIFVKE